MSSSFALLGVPEQLVNVLARRGVHEPFPIQAATLPDALAGRDIAGRAPTGSGKTLAFGLAVAELTLRSGRPRPRRPRVLVLVPTRELAAQVQRELQALVPRESGPVAAVYGGVGYGPQRRALAQGADAVVACPGRLEDLVSTGDVVLDGVELVVIDEADRMADMGFMPAVKRLLDRTPDGRQTLLFSATLDGDVDALVKRYQREPARHEVAGEEADSGDITHLFWRVARSDRSQVAAQVIDRVGPTVVFCRTCHGADRVAKQLSREGVEAVAIHGRRSQGQRSRALAAFTNGKAPALVATDVAAHGIHVDGVACVLHFDMPEDPKDFVHRSGRTGRAGADGLVVSLIAVEDGDRKTRQLQRALDRPEPIERVDLERLADRPAPRPAPAPVSTAGDDFGTFDEPRDGEGHAGPRRTSRPRKPRSERADERRRRGDRPNGDRNGSPSGSGGRGRSDGRSGGSGGDFAGERSSGSGGSASGTVTVFHADRGFGFISRREGGDVFVHASNVGGQSLSPGQRVRFDVAPGRRGSQAVNVRPA